MHAPVTVLRPEPRHSRRDRRRIGRSSWVEKGLDRYLGACLVFASGAVRPKRRPPSSVDTIGILQTAAIGDTVLTTVLLRALRTRFPEARIELFLGPSNIGLAPLLTDVDVVATLAVKRPLETIGALRRRRLDVLIDCGPWPRLNALYAAYSGAHYLVGFKSDRQFRHYVYDCVVDHRTVVHEVENVRALARALGADDKSPPRLAIPPGTRTDVPASPFVVFHPWSGGSRAAAKEWALERWIELGVRVAAQGRTVIVTGSVADEPRSRHLVSQLEERGCAAHSTAGSHTLSELAVLLCHAAAVVSVDTGVMHMAAALGAPVVSLHGPTASRRWGPVGLHTFPVDAPGDGVGYLRFGFERAPKSTPNLMDRITVDVVSDRLRQAVARGRPARVAVPARA